MIPTTSNDTDGTLDGIQTGSFHNWVNMSLNYHAHTSIDYFTSRLTEVAKNEPLTVANKGLPFMVDYGAIPQSELDARMHIVSLPSTSPFTTAVSLYGQAADPIIQPSQFTCDIDWNLTVEIDQSVSPPRAKVTGIHDAFPAYEIYVDGQPIYQWKPPLENTVLDLCDPNPFGKPDEDVSTAWISIR